MFSNAEVDALLALDKRGETGTILIRLGDSKTRTILHCDTHEEYTFLVQVELNQKINFKVSLHHQENNTSIGLFRVDYKGSHQNPKDATKAPVMCKPYAGKFFDTNEPHAHVYSDAYRPMVWAVPLKDVGFSTSTIKSSSDTENAIREFFIKINVITPLTVEQML